MAIREDGVLSNYKIHGPDTIEFSRHTDVGSRLIGDATLHLTRR